MSSVMEIFLFPCILDYIITLIIITFYVSIILVSYKWFMGKCDDKFNSGVLG